MTRKLIVLVLLVMSSVSFAADNKNMASLKQIGTVHNSIKVEGFITDVFFSPSGNNLLTHHNKSKFMKVITINKDSIEVSGVPYGRGVWDQSGELHVDAGRNTKVIKAFVDNAKADPNDIKNNKVYFTDQNGNRFKEGKVNSKHNKWLLKTKVKFNSGYIPIEAVVVHDNGFEHRLELGKQRNLKRVEYDSKKKRIALCFDEEYAIYDLRKKMSREFKRYIHSLRTEYDFHLVKGEDLLFVFENQLDSEGHRYIRSTLKLCEMGGQVLSEVTLKDENKNIDIGTIVETYIYKDHIALLMGAHEGNQKLRIYAVEKTRSKGKSARKPQFSMK